MVYLCVYADLQRKSTITTAKTLLLKHC
jgi:hypothetical protein